MTAVVELVSRVELLGAPDDEVAVVGVGFGFGFGFDVVVTATEVEVESPSVDVVATFPGSVIDVVVESTGAIVAGAEAGSPVVGGVRTSR